MNTQLDHFGVTERKGIPIVNSMKISDMFSRRHDNILRDIEEIRSNLLIIEEIDFDKNFIPSTYKDSKGRKQPSFDLTRDAFMLVVMGFKGTKAMRIKVSYIQRFNDMEAFVKSLTAAKLEFPYFTESIMSAHDEPKHYHFSNEINMINKIVLGMDAKKFKEANGLGEVGSIRPYLNQQQIYAIEMLQKFDTGLIVTEPDFSKRKEILNTYYNRIIQIRALKEGA